MSAALPLDVQCTHRAPLRAEGRRRMAAVLAISAVVMLAEAAGGWVAHSLALLADAGHMLADVGALGLRPASASWRPLPPRPGAPSARFDSRSWAPWGTARRR